MYTIEKGVLEKSCILFHVPSNFAKSSFFYLINAGEFYCDGNYKIERDNYNNYLIMYIKEGSGHIKFNNKTFTAKKNDVVFLNCYKPHSYYTLTGWNIQWFHFDGNSSKKLFNMIFERTGVVLSLQNSNVIQLNISKILENLKSKTIIPESIISCYIHRILAEMIVISAETNFSEDKKSNYITDAITFIECNYQQKIDLESISRSVNLSPYYFSREFKQMTGYSPYEYLINTRINKAKMLLKKSNMSIKEIAFSVGYSCESNFVDAFHKITSLTPKKFRETPM